MTISATAITLSSLFSLFGLWWFLSNLYRDWRTDVFRQHMFALRANLFDAAADQIIDFNSPSYGQLRTTINGFIRFAHRISLVQLIVLMLSGSDEDLSLKGDRSFHDRWARNIGSLSDKQKALLEAYRARMEILVFRHVVESSPILLMTILVPLASFFIAKFCIGSLLRLIKMPLNRMDSAAMALGRAC